MSSPIAVSCAVCISAASKQTEEKRAIEFISKLNNCFSYLSCLSRAFMHIFLPLLNEIIRISSVFSLSQLSLFAARNKQKREFRMTIDNHRTSLWPSATA